MSGIGFEIISIITAVATVFGFAFKIISANHFDRIFLPKYQQYLQISIFMVFLFVFYFVYTYIVAYFSIFSPLSSVMGYVIIIYFALVLSLFLFVLLKFICKLFKKDFVMRNLPTSFIVSALVLHIIICSYLNTNIVEEIKLQEHSENTNLDTIEKEIYLTDDNSNVIEKEYHIANANSDAINITLLNSSFFYLLSIGYFIMFQYVTGSNKKKLSYIMIPTPNDIKEQHLFVLYSLNSSTLVLSNNPKVDKNPEIVHLYDMSRDDYVSFCRVTVMEDTKR